MELLLYRSTVQIADHFSLAGLFFKDELELIAESRLLNQYSGLQTSC